MNPIVDRCKVDGLMGRFGGERNQTGDFCVRPLSVVETTIRDSSRLSMHLFSRAALLGQLRDLQAVLNQAGGSLGPALVSFLMARLPQSCQCLPVANKKLISY